MMILLESINRKKNGYKTHNNCPITNNTQMEILPSKLFTFLTVDFVSKKGRSNRIRLPIFNLSFGNETIFLYPKDEKK